MPDCFEKTLIRIIYMMSCLSNQQSDHDLDFEITPQAIKEDLAKI